MTTTGVHPASMIRRARVLLALDTSVGVVDEKKVIAARLGVDHPVRPRSVVDRGRHHKHLRHDPQQSNSDLGPSRPHGPRPTVFLQI
ncbi:hypothetical protein [Rhodococcus koreensis]